MPESTRAYIGLLREALASFVDAVDHPIPPKWGLHDLEWRAAEARRLLALETGRHAQAEWKNATDLNSVGYILADYVYHRLYGVPRSRSGLVPTDAEAREALEAIQRLTEQAWALEALLVDPEEQRRG